jgi:hypothetical protein
MIAKDCAGRAQMSERTKGGWMSHCQTLILTDAQGVMLL